MQRGRFGMRDAEIDTDNIEREIDTETSTKSVLEYIQGVKT